MIDKKELKVKDFKSNKEDFKLNSVSDRQPM